jgi:hypothetical protein
MVPRIPAHIEDDWSTGPREIHGRAHLPILAHEYGIQQRRLVQYVEDKIEDIVRKKSRTLNGRRAHEGHVGQKQRVLDAGLVGPRPWIMLCCKKLWDQVNAG